VDFANGFQNGLKSKPDLRAKVKPHAVVVTTGAGVVEAVVVLVRRSLAARP
jgi:hypothetical protein